MDLIDSENATTEPGPESDVPMSMVERMTRILDAFDGRGSRLSLAEVAGRARIPRSTVYRILDQLVRTGWVEHTSGGYGLGRRATGFGGGDEYGRIRAAAAPLLHELQLRTGMVVHLTVLDHGDSLYLDKIGGRFATHVPSRVGGRVPAYCTAGGKAILAWLKPEVVDGLYGSALLPRTDRTITDRTALHHELNRIRLRRGLAFERNESVDGIACVGAAVRGGEGPVAAVSLCGEADIVRLNTVAPLVAEVAREVSESLYPELRDRRHRRKATAPDRNPLPCGAERLLSAAAG
ncbi:IclR family transcriptional regulator [Nocardia carnea]|uniref:IclR family transcriptional regulator n=1 Tax=Nocardia carnea TaxID=37328 RepID=UPI0024567E24|nr:IclR family transcriptional regulator [Nocardia carnea]